MYKSCSAKGDKNDDEEPTEGGVEDLQNLDLEPEEEEDDDEAVELSETITVDGVEYYVHEQDGLKIAYTKEHDPVGVYDEETDTIQEAEFEFE